MNRRPLYSVLPVGKGGIMIFVPIIPGLITTQVGIFIGIFLGLVGLFMLTLFSYMIYSFLKKQRS